MKVYLKELHENGVEIAFKRDSANCFIEFDGELYKVSVDGSYVSDMTYEKMFINTDEPSSVNADELYPVEERFLKMMGIDW